MLWSAFIFGLIGSFHCLGMCGPIAFLLPLDKTSFSKSSIQLSIYHLGRIFTYSIIGAVFGLLGKSFRLFGLQQQVSIIVGLIMILVVLIPSLFQKINITRKVYSFTNRVKNELGKSLKMKDNPTFFTIGFLNGLLPCGLVYMAVFGAVESSNFLDGMLYMAVFGFGTIPMMASVAFMRKLSFSMNRQNIQKVIPFVIVAIGVLFVLRGMGLGIPYISPIIHSVDGGAVCH